MSATYKYILDFVAKTDKFKSEVTGLNGFIKGAVTAAAGLFATDKVLEFGAASVEAYNNSIQAETALLTALKGRKDVQQALIAQATELMGKTLFDDDDIVRAQSLVAAFVKEEGAIKRLMPAILDFASAKQMDLGSATDMVTRTLNGEMEALGRTGIKIHGVAGSAERLTSIIKGLNDAYGGQAEAAAKVGTGALTILGNQYENLKETIGGFLLSTQGKQDSYTNILAQDLSDWSKLFEIWGNETVSTWDKTISSIKYSKMNEVWLSMDGGKHKLEEIKKNAEGAAKSLEALTGWMKTPTIDFSIPTATGKTYTNSIEGLNEKLKDYNEELTKIAPNDNKALTAKLQQINATENQIKGIDKLKTKLEAIQAMNADPMRGMKLTEILPSWTRNNAVGGSVNSVKQKKEVDVYSNFYSSGDTKPKMDISDFIGNTEKANKAQEALQAMLDKSRQKVEAVQNAFASGFEAIGKSVVDGLGLASTGLEGFLGKLAETAIQLISMMLAQSLATAIFGATESGTATGPAAVFTTPAFIATAIAGVMGAFAAIAFADGGIVSGPTHALVGEYPGARSNPEVIAPLSKLKAMIGGGSGDSIILQPSLELGYDSLRVRLNRVDANTKKRNGK